MSGFSYLSQTIGFTKAREKEERGGTKNGLHLLCAGTGPYKWGKIEDPNLRQETSLFMLDSCQFLSSITLQQS